MVEMIDLELEAGSLREDGEDDDQHEDIVENL
jgi:hypothetical protein